MATTALATALICIGFLLSPLLIIEEKESHTFETLLVSPASSASMIQKAISFILKSAITDLTGIALSNQLPADFCGKASKACWGSR